MKTPSRRGSAPTTCLVLALSAVAAMSAGCRHPQDGTVADSVSVDGRSRTFLYHVPSTPPPPAETASESAGATSYPLVIHMHGRLGDGISEEKHTNMTDLAEREGFIVAYPDGVDRSWHDKRESGPAAEKNVDDVAFIRALIDKMITEHSADPKRVYVAGISNGGFMTMRLACELSEKIAAVATFIATMPENGAEQCKPTHPMPIAMFLGTEDPLVPYGGGDIHGKVLSADATRDRWATLDGCEPADLHETINTADDDTVVKKTAYTKCQKGSEVLFFSIEGGGHTYPSGDQYLPKAIIGRVSHDIDGSHEIWQFFKRHSL